MSEQEEIESCKVVLLGESGVGKTSIISQFIEETFLEDQSSSSGATFLNKNIELQNGKSLKLEIWDTAGQERYRSLAKMFYKDAAIAILVYDITRKESFNEMKNYWTGQLMENASKNIIIAIAGNKSDLFENEQVDEAEAREFAKSINAIFRQTSAKNAEGIVELFSCIGNKFSNPEFDPDQIPEASKKQKLRLSKKQNLSNKDKSSKKKGCFCQMF